MMTDENEPAALANLRALNARLEGDILHLIRHDQLTGLLNRASFIAEVDRVLETPEGHQRRSALIEFGVRSLPRITGTLGRYAGDYVISALAARLNLLKGFESLKCRLDYWSFAIFIPDVDDALEALTKTKSILELLSQPVDWIDRKINVELGAGVAMTTEADVNASTLLQNVGLALKAATEKGGPGYAFFNPALAQSAKRKADVLTALGEALETHSLSMDFQPFFDTRTGALIGFESLMRMRHDQLGNVSPAEFIPVAEESGLIGRIGAWALADACRVAAGWPAHLSVAVNISPEQFYGGTLITDVHNALELSSFPAYRLEIEITESTLLKDSEVVLAQLQTLRDMGCAIVLDDFGTGYSSLSYLWKFPFSKLKIDRTFVQAIDTTPLVRGMLESIIGLSRNLGLKITAEGIESQRHVEVLRGYGCDYLQGFLLGRPAHEQNVQAIIFRSYADQLRQVLPTATITPIAKTVP